jgi:hypothetical protein
LWPADSRSTRSARGSFGAHSAAGESVLTVHHIHAERDAVRARRSAGAQRWANLAPYSLAEAARDALLIAAAVIATQLTWYRRPQQRLRRVSARHRLPSAWAGFRGGVSLAHRLVTCGVILVTLLMTRGTALGPTA